MLVVDLLHEFELGVWKALFTHLIRILYAAAPDRSLVAELDRRYVNFSAVSYRQINNLSCYNQVSGHANVRLRHNQAFCNECLGNEEACSAQFRGLIAGNVNHFQHEERKDLVLTPSSVQYSGV
jgi:hypothetical protein